MKIVLLTEKYTPDIGGLAISSDRLARLLTSAGHDVRVFAPTLSLLPSEQRTHTSNRVTVTRFGAHKRVDDTLVHWFDIITEEHARDPFDVLHAYFLTQAGFIATLAGRYLNIPSVVSIRGNDVDRAAFDPARFSHSMFALQNANVVTANAKESIRKAKAFIDREIVLIPNGVDADHFKPMERNEALAESLGLERKRKEERDDVEKWSVESGGAVIGFVGELREKKGLRTLLSAYAQVNKKQRLTLLIVGEVRHGDDSQTFDEMRASIPESNIIVTGYISPNDLPAYYSLMDVFVHPSLHDGMPNAILEAMACERAVIATPVGGVLDIVEDGRNGVFVNASDENQLAKKILGLLDDPVMRARLGKHARGTIAEKFTPQNELSANLEVYRKLGLHP